MKKMTLKEFKEYCDINDYNIVKNWDFKRFECRCKKCNSDNIQIGHKSKEYHYSTLTGQWSSGNNGLLIKCLDCGQAITIILSD